MTFLNGVRGFPNNEVEWVVRQTSIRHLLQRNVIGGTETLRMKLILTKTNIELKNKVNIDERKVKIANKSIRHLLERNSIALCVKQCE